MPPRPPSHEVIVERIDGLIRLTEQQFANGARRFDRIEERLGKIEAHQLQSDEARAALTASVAALTAAQPQAGPWWQGWIKPALLVVLALLAGAGLSIIAITQLDVLGPLIDAAKAVHDARGPQS